MTRRLCGLLLCLALLPGCYTRVVDAEGIGSESVDTEEANIEGEPDLEVNNPDRP